MKAGSPQAVNITTLNRKTHSMRYRRTISAKQHRMCPFLQLMNEKHAAHYVQSTYVNAVN